MVKEMRNWHSIAIACCTTVLSALGHLVSSLACFDDTVSNFITVFAFFLISALADNDKIFNINWIMIMLHRYTSILIAALFPLVLFGWFAPQPAGQIDFLLLWLMAMLFLALPVIFAEVALASRSKKSPLSGMQVLTREADASVFWRGFAWLSTLVAMLISALAISSVGSSLLNSLVAMNITVDIPQFAWLAGLMVVAMILGFLGIRLLLVGVLLVVVAWLMGFISGGANLHFMMTEVSLAEWGRAVVLALVSVGAGTGLYWFAQSHGMLLSDVGKSATPSMTKQVLSVWIVQVISGSLALIGNGLTLPFMAQMVYVLGVLCVVGFLLHYASKELSGRFGWLVGSLLTLVVSLVMVMLFPSKWLMLILLVVSSVTVLFLSIFAGWQMKISHLRKVLNFGNEGIYNLWRIFIRLVVPLSVLLGLVGWIMG